jgi:ubiquinone/menaquinone biosynthesis C-methylase UbiE
MEMRVTITTLVGHFLSCWWGRRVPEPEVMDSPDEVEAYTDAAAQRYLAQLDDGAARRAAALAPRARCAVDLGCGPAAIPLSVAGRLPDLFIVGVDLSLPMLRRARQEARRRGLGHSLRLVCASAAALPFRGGCFDLVMCNSLLHHLARPEQVMKEAARVAAPRAAFFLRDLRRPPRLCLGAHLRWFGRHYEGEMRRLFEISVRAAYTRREVQCQAEDLRGAAVRRRGGAHLEVVRAAGE